MRIVNARVLDLDTDQASPPTTITIGDGVIESIGPDDAPAAAGDVDAAGGYVLPGLVNSHEHLSLKGRLLDPDGEQYYDVYRAPAERQLLHCARSLLVSLGRGITTVRDAGAAWMVNLAARDAVRAGVLPGPRVYTCGQVLSIPFEGTMVKTAGMTVDAAGVDGVIETVDGLVKQGVDFIKLKGHRRDFSDPNRNNYFSDEEIITAGREAHRHGLRFALHAWHCHVVTAALEAGVVDSIEHGNPLHERPEILEKMAADGVILVPNVVSWAPGPEARWSRYPDMAGIALERVWDTVRLAIEAGVTLAAGTDLHNDELHTELQAYVRLGLTPTEALKTATVNGAKLLGLDGELGTVAPGKLADLVVLDRDPRADLTAIATPVTVVSRGVAHDGAQLRRLVAPARP
ncbi:amidohydrolase family protein [Dactylosporangium sp. CA-092794]|uniref:amidohydrolase family protein n=1 Tax=Dactylosporangium sp. CA-092794 TaxID=3239929 RepID=UPI003D8AE309